MAGGVYFLSHPLLALAGLTLRAVGMLVGVNLLTTGFSRLMLATAARTIAREIRA